LTLTVALTTVCCLWWWWWCIYRGQRVLLISCWTWTARSTQSSRHLSAEHHWWSDHIVVSCS